MTTHTMHIAAEQFAKIANGTKVIESRLYDTKRQKICLGDTIVFACNDDPSQTVCTTVTALYHYPTFAALFADFPPQLFGNASKDESLREIEMFYSKRDQEENGVIGIKIELT